MAPWAACSAEALKAECRNKKGCVAPEQFQTLELPKHCCCHCLGKAAAAALQSGFCLSTAQMC